MELNGYSTKLWIHNLAPVTRIAMIGLYYIGVGLFDAADETTFQ